ncbi:muellerian-inhibiting factor [Stigmatopora argus]
MLLLYAVLMVCSVGHPETSVTGERSPRPPTYSTPATHVPPSITACFLEDLLAALREASGEDGRVMPGAFGTCAAASGNLAVLSDLATEARDTRGGLERLHPNQVSLVEKDEEALMLNFGFPQSPLLQQKPTLLLALDNPIGGGDLDRITFTSPSLHPNTQAVCLSEGTQYILLTGQAAKGDLNWMLSVDTKSPKMRKRMKELLTDGNTQRSSVTPVLLFTRQEDSSPSVGDSSRPISFLCELRRFLSGVLPQRRPDSPPLRLDTLQAPPPVTLDPSSSEAELADLINSSAPTVFSFTGSTYHIHRGELAMPRGLLDELRRNLELNLVGAMEVLRDKADGQRSAGRLQRLWELCAFSKLDSVSGESQYRAFLLLKALKMVGREVLPQPRATRAEPDPSTRTAACRLKSLTVSLQSFLVGPNTANINNCHGLCTFPLVNTKDHAVLLNWHIENGDTRERAPCCVPVDYESLEVVDLNQHGTHLYTHPDMVAKKCGCR